MSGFSGCDLSPAALTQFSDGGPGETPGLLEDPLRPAEEEKTSVQTLMSLKCPYYGFMKMIFHAVCNTIYHLTLSICLCICLSI